MKKITIFFTGLALMWMAAACSLDERILDTPGPVQVTSDQELLPLINGLYSRFNDANAFKFRGWLMLTLCADDFYSVAANEFQPFANRTYGGPNVSHFYNSLYLAVGAANQLIGILDKVGDKLTPELVSRAYGEAYFVRAFSYYYLVRLYGGVPLRISPVNADSDMYLPRASIHEVYEQIFADFREASLRLPQASELPVSELGRATKGAAQAIVAQAYLTYGNQRSLRGMDPTQQYEEAVLFADSVIHSGQYQLIPNYADIFDINKEVDAYKEVIFGIRFQADPMAILLGSAGSEYAFRFGNSNTHFVSGNANNGQGDGSVRPMHWMADYYLNHNDYVHPTQGIRDYRHEVTFVTRGYNSTNDRYVVPYPFLPTTQENPIVFPLLAKYQDPNGRDHRNNGNDFFVIRFSEMYFILVEALNELHGGPTYNYKGQQLFWWFNRVRARAQLADGTSRNRPFLINNSNSPGMTQDEFRMRIFHERGLELLGEGQRWFDLVRMRHPSDPTKTMYEYQLVEELTKSTYPKDAPTYTRSSNSYSNSFYVYEPSLNVSVPKHLLFPIPIEEMVRNPNFGEQNPRW
ncbi:RagB/SusD family nutrient uptake outer membrane protein [Parapedobacter sp. SGR-10]|uniref:RagB/SusD family nutrient uptake outer membrane protein n=1 Tax=Parapedobacter sp. SGR-10 TaxID=2710879 RepID=UPI0013D22780|nr:RagB/SusD family nutrient uptake outer membrane protein [Parapedobacter sp. SGR-10]NGF56940.1 RagB/SusD family nutrient uptake outer membrane protein [Parapedobacter sp. SGR-10]